MNGLFALKLVVGMGEDFLSRCLESFRAEMLPICFVNFFLCRRMETLPGSSSGGIYRDALVNFLAGIAPG